MQSPGEPKEKIFLGETYISQMKLHEILRKLQENVFQCVPNATLMKLFYYLHYANNDYLLLCF